MHLKRLDIVGFKSFADNIRLDLEPGITAIVGPNGCGKSNIIDAVRWCLGEMSAKSLRSNLMMDVVFNGSGSRPPQNMAEVTLTFNNSDKRLPIDFSEVSISRRLFRSGESEYFINKTQCRLRDIRELFLDTGMGEDGYSSLEQGKVEWILQAKPEERRELFEEAAGVSKYRARREEALRKLEKVEVDLSRLNDIVLVTQDQIRKLENAVNKAKTYQRIREELRSMEISDWLFQLSNSDNELVSVGERISEGQKLAEELNTKQHQLDAQISEHRLQLTQLEEELLKANTALNNIDSDVKIGEERLNYARRRQVEIEEQRMHSFENLQREEERLKVLVSQRDQLVQALEEIKRQGSQIESGFSDSKSSFDNAETQLQQRRQELKSLRDLIFASTEQRNQLQSQMGQLSSDLARMISKKENIEKDRLRIQSQYQQIEEKMAQGQSQTDELKTQFNDKSHVLSEMSHQIRQLEERESVLRLDILGRAEDIAKLKGQIHSIQDQQSEDPYLAGVHAVMGENFPGIYGPIGNLFQADELNRDIVASTLGENLGDLVADTSVDAQRAIDFLKESEKGRVRIWILDKIDGAHDGGLFANLPNGNALLNCVRAEEKFRPLLRYLCSSMYIQGTSVFGKSFINGGIDPAKWQSHINHRLPELENALKEREGQKTLLEQELNELDKSLILASQNKDVALKEMEEVRIRLELALEDLARISSQKESIAEEQSAIDMDAERILSEEAQAQLKHDESMQQFNQLQEDEKSNHLKMDQLQKELSDIQQIHAQASAELSAQQEKLQAFQEKLNWQTSVVEHNQNEIKNIDSNIVRLKSQIEDSVRLKEEVENHEKEANELIQTSLNQRQGAADECSRIQTLRASLTEQVQSWEGELSKLRSELNQANEAIQRDRINEANIKNRLETLTQKLHDQYEMTLETAKAEFVTPTAADVETLEKLRKRVANMGPINLAAPQEHEELVQKNEFLTTQQNDLIKAREDLKQVIAKINSTTRDHFRETFNKVRENFRTLYSTLFQGGEADLRFTDETDILNTGVDIFCQPPGKKLLHISLLSGGEKALTAIALLFAFFQVRPSPVALLDEVDAPLDEANVLRYAEMIKKFSENSQFLLISHNKRTMEAANTLYGVTMEELGVSKVLSARLNKKDPVPAESAAA